MTRGAAQVGLALLLAAAGPACAGNDEASEAAPRAPEASEPAAPAETPPPAATGAVSAPFEARTSTGQDGVSIVDSNVDFHRKRLHLRSAGPEDGPAVLLLHGMKFDSHTWEQLGTLSYLAERGMRVVAIDAPGFGKSEASDVKPEDLLAELIPALGLKRPVIVAPSMGGLFAFPYAVAHPDDVAGLVPVAPAGLDEWLPKLKDCPVPALVVWGSADTIMPVARADDLVAALKNSRKLILEGAPHPAYLERPQEFHEALVEFVRSVAAGRSAGG